jgi:hypothetical protein
MASKRQKVALELVFHPFSGATLKVEVLIDAMLRYCVSLTAHSEQ